MRDIPDARVRLNNYLTNVLKIPDWKTILEKDKVEFLNVFLRSVFVNVYFQNVRMAAKEICKRRIPSIEQVIESGFRGEGGVCNEINVFNKLILVSLGLDAFNIVATVYKNNGIPDSHVMTVVRLSGNEMYLVDTAFGSPLQAVVPLHQLPHSGKAAGFYYEFREVDGIYYRYQVGGRFLQGEYEGDVKEEQRLSFTLKQREYRDFNESMEIIYTSIPLSSLLKSPFLFRYTEFTKEKCQFVLVRDNWIMVADVDSREVTIYDSYDDMLETVDKYFPNLKKKEVELAWKAFNDVKASISL